MTFAASDSRSVQHGSDDVMSAFDTTDFSTPVTQDLDESGQKELQAKHDNVHYEDDTMTLKVGDDGPNGGQTVEVRTRAAGCDPMNNTEEASDAVSRIYTVTGTDDSMSQHSVPRTAFGPLPIQKPFRLIAAVDGSSSSHDGFVAAMVSKQIPGAI